MKTAFIFFANGFEEVEALTVVDLLRRANIKTYMISITGDKLVLGAHKIPIITDKLFEEIENEETDLVVLPGGMPGTRNLQAHKGLEKFILHMNELGKFMSAICAAPVVYGNLGLLKGKNVTSYPGFNEELIGANYKEDAVVVDGNFITSRGVGTAIEFSGKLIELLLDESIATQVKSSIIYVK